VVISLLPSPETFARGVTTLVAFVDQRVG
jgi:hypothetical protein